MFKSKWNKANVLWWGGVLESRPWCTLSPFANLCRLFVLRNKAEAGVLSKCEHVYANSPLSTYLMHYLALASDEARLS